jgi:L-malate glycosyltransferase
MKSRLYIFIKRITYFLYAFYNLVCFFLFDIKKIKEADLVCFFPYYHTGGAERVHVEIVKAFIGKKVCIIFTHKSATQNFLNDFKLVASIIEINNIKNKNYTFINALLLRKMVKVINESTSIVSVFGCNTNYFYELLPFLKSSIRKIDLFHALAPNDSREPLISNSSKHINNRVVINHKTKNDIFKIYKKNQLDLAQYEKIVIIENGINSENVSFQIKKDNPIKIGFIGRWSDEKRPELFLKVVIQIQKQIEDVLFYMAGTGMKSNIDKIQKANVHFLGEITSDTILIDLYRNLHFIVITSEYEGFPMVIMESMIYGVVPISTQVGGLSEHITNGSNGVLVDNNQDDITIVDSFVKEIVSLIQNKEQLEKMSEDAYNYAKSHFSIADFKTKYNNLFFN